MLSKKIGLDHILPKLRNSRITMRVDYNVPLKDNQVKDATRIQETIPSLKKILDQKPKGITLLSHLGRPNGQINLLYSLKPIVPVLEDLLGRKVTFIDNSYTHEAVRRSIEMQNQEILLLENIRFNIEEEGSMKDQQGNKIKATPQQIYAFRSHLNSLGNIYVNDAFGTSHRAHSSMVGITCPIRAAGDLLKKELDYFSQALENPKRPFLVILGGAKISDKIPLINNLLEKVDEMIIGGGMAFTFLKALGYNVGNSLVDNEKINTVKEILNKAKEKNVKIILPVDFIGAENLNSRENLKQFTLEKGIQDGFMGLDCGQKTIELNKKSIIGAKTIVLNGPQGAFENSLFSEGSIQCVNSIIEATQKGCISIAGGGDTLNLLNQIKGSKEKISHVSTGGGASLELLEGKILPGVNHLTSIDELNYL